VEILIKNGYVYDPLNEIDGEVVDIAIKDGKIVDPSEVDPTKAKVIDARGKAVLPGGIDLHSHVAGPKVNTGRIMRPEDHYRSFMRAVPGVRRSGTGKTTPSTFIAGYRYARMGWTTVMEPATPPLKTRHTHEEMNDIPMVDKACFVLMDSNRLILEAIEEKDYELCKALVKWLLDATKSYAIKLVDPGVAIPWSLGRGYGLDLDDQIEPYGITPRDIVTTLCKVNQELKLPHPIHVHCNRLGIPGNCETTLRTMDAVSHLSGGEVDMHVTHIQFNAYLGANWFELRSGGEEIAKYVNSKGHVSLDLGQIDFGTATTMTADAPFEFALYHMARWKWAGAEVEGEAAAGIVPFKYKKKSLVNAIQWCIGLEVALLVKDPWRVVLTTDHPNGAPFTRYPKIIGLLMSKKFREEAMQKLSKAALKRVALPAVDREYTLYEIAIVTRAGPAKLLGIEEFKGHLGVGADADVAIYDVDPTQVDFSEDYQKVVQAFKRAAYTIKGGEIVVKDGEIVKEVYGDTLYLKFEREIEEDLLKQIEERFRKWYTVEFSNYFIEERELKKRRPIPVAG